MKSMLILFCCLASAACTTARADESPVQVVENVEIERYLGVWYEIASIPQRFQRNCFATQAEYSWADSDTIRVVNSCRKGALGGPLSRATGKAWLPDADQPAKLKVQFFWPFSGDYWIIELDQADYQYAVVGHPDREYLWILSRTRQMDNELFGDLMDRIAEVHRYDVSLIQRTAQPED